MEMAAVKHTSGQRLQQLCIIAETFVEERMITCLLQSILSGGRVEIIQGNQSDEEYSDLYDEEASVFCFGRQNEAESEESSESTEKD